MTNIEQYQQLPQVTMATDTQVQQPVVMQGMPLQLLQGQMSLQQNQIPMQQGNLPFQQGQIPIQQGQFQIQQGQFPIHQGQIQVQGQLQQGQPQVDFTCYLLSFVVILVSWFPLASSFI